MKKLSKFIINADRIQRLKINNINIKELKPNNNKSPRIEINSQSIADNGVLNYKITTHKVTTTTKRAATKYSNI